MQGIFAESPNRVYVLMRGELPLLERPEEVPYPNIGPSISFPVSQTPFRNASVGPVTSPGNTGSDGWNGWKGKLGVDARWEHNLFVVDAGGNIIESWTQWDSIMRRPHSVFVNPYDPEKHVWVVDDRQHAVYKFTNDGKQLVQTLGVRGEAGDRRQALQPSDVHGVAAGQHALRQRRLRQHTRGEVRQGRKVPDGVGRQGHAAERHPPRHLRRGARRRRRPRHAAGST